MSPYPIDNLRQKGFYVARIDGPDDTYVVGRSFLSGRKRGRSWEYSPDDIGQLPAWVIRSGLGPTCHECGHVQPAVELIAAFPHGWEVVGQDYASRDLLAIWEQGPPDSPETQIRTALDDRVPVYAADLDTPF